MIEARYIEDRIKECEAQIKISWKRGYSSIDWTKALIFLVLGKKGSGKSALLESLALRYRKIIDLFGSRDNENLAWLRKSSPINDALLVIGDNVDLNCSWPTKHASALTLSDILHHDAVITCDGFYSNQQTRFMGINKILDNLWLRDGWSFPIFVAIREASSFLYSRIKMEGVNMKMAKADFIFFQREMRHLGYTLGIDTIRWTSIDKEMRDLADLLIIKKVGSQGLPSDISYLYKYASPPSLATLKPDRFVVQADYAIGFGWSGLPVFHKEEGVSLMKELDMNPEYGEVLEESTNQQVGDEEHIKIIQLRSSGTSMENISATIHRSLSTVHRHIKDHNKEVGRLGECSKCKRGHGDMFDCPLE